MSELAGIVPPSVGEDPVRRALDCLQEGFQVIGFDWRYIYVNPAAARHGRRAAHELIGMSMLEAYPEVEKTPMFATLRRAMEERTRHVFENEFTFPDGSRRWFEIRVHPCPEGICVYSSDIEYRKRRQLERAARSTGRQGLLRRIWSRLAGR